MRLDKWLWCARFYKTRSLAAEEISKGRVLLNATAAKPARDVRVGDTLQVRQGPLLKTVVVQGLNPSRGPAPIAQQMYAETEDSLAARARAAELMRLAPEPAFDHQYGRPTKKDRRALETLKHGSRAPMDERWSASL